MCVCVCVWVDVVMWKEACSLKCDVTAQEKRVVVGDKGGVIGSMSYTPPPLKRKKTTRKNTRLHK